MSTTKPPQAEKHAFQSLQTVESARHEMLCKAARTLLEWNRPLEEIVDITGLSREEIEALRH
ncbi:MAG: hypothetical protein LBI92_09030 [Azoarcus sp.]|jgi:hypothetical protein|nr:hypothetical protein [Azoarcus sp.]